MNNTEVYSAEKADALDSGIRKVLQNPKRILRGIIKEGMKVIDFGAGTGYFTLPIAEAVGPGGRVLAVDIQREMLERIREKGEAAGFTERIETAGCLGEGGDAPGSDLADAALIFYVVHEVPEQDELARRLYDSVKPGGICLLAEPKKHVSEEEFEVSVKLFEAAGFRVTGRMRICCSRSILLRKVRFGKSANTVSGFPSRPQELLSCPGPSPNFRARIY